MRHQAVPCPDRERFTKEMLHKMGIFRLIDSVLLLSWASLIARAESASPTVEAEIRRIANAAAGEVGVAAWRLDGHGPRFLLNADEAFPMASTFKLCVSVSRLANFHAGT